jgi:hypothetical protein
VCTTPSGAHWHRGQEGVEASAHQSELLELCLSRRDEATGANGWCVDGKLDGNAGKMDEVVGTPPKENGPGRHGRWPRRERQGALDWGIVLWAPASLRAAVVWWCRIGEPPGR